MIHYKFSKEVNKEFSKTLKTRVNAYFRENDICRNGDHRMALKSAIAIGFYVSLYLTIVLGGITSVPALFALWMLMGVGQAFIGTAVMHDVLHGSYSKKKSVNAWMNLSAMIVGVEPFTWKIQHNVLHHTYTNIEDADEDIEVKYVLRFTENQPRRWFHRFQHIYVVFFYSIPIIIWATAKDFIKMVKYRKLGLVKKGGTFRRILAGIIFRKALFHFCMLGIPIMVLPVAPGLVVLMFISMLLVTGLCLSLIFQTAHLTTDLSFIQQEEENIEENWSVHQLYTTTNYAPNNKFFTWFFGALNFQVEHHLFPDVCHIHYPQLAKIVKSTAQEFDLPYHSQPTFGSAIVKHFQMLHALGRYDVLPAAVK